MKHLSLVLASMLLCLFAMAQNGQMFESSLIKSESKMNANANYAGNNSIDLGIMGNEVISNNDNQDVEQDPGDLLGGVFAKKHGRKFIAFSVAVNGDVDWLSGPGAEGFDPGLGFGAGVSLDVFHNTNYGIELGLYYHNYGIGWGTSAADHHWSSRLSYLDAQLMFDPRLFFSDNSSIEANIGVGFNFGLDSPVKYKGKKAEGYTLFGGYGDGNGGILKDYSMALLLGMTYRFSEGYVRALYHHGMSKLNAKSTEKVTLCNFELAFGFTWEIF